MVRSRPASSSDFASVAARGPRRRHPASPGRRRSGGHDRRTVLVALVLTALTLITLDVRGFGPVRAARQGALSVFGPVAGVATGLVRPIGDGWAGATQGAALRRENDSLRLRVEELQGRVAQDEAAEAELARLREALDLPHAGDLRRVTARVTSGAVADFDVTVEIDKGADAGIARDMPVVVDAGLVGSVVEVAPGRSVVRLVSDPTLRVGVVPAGGTWLGLVAGTGDPVRARVSDFDAAAELSPGTVLVTAGSPGSRFPPGIPVGRIERLERDEVRGLQRGEVRLGPRLDTLAFVTVLVHVGAEPWGP